MKTITAYQSDDGSIHQDKQKALEADVEYWRKKALEAEPYKRKAEEEARHEPGYDGGHQ